MAIEGLLEINGGNFEIAGTPVSAGPHEVQPKQMLTGVLTDGTVFVFRQLDPLTGVRDALPGGGNMTLIETTIPPQGPDVINAPADEIPNGLRHGQVLNMANGAEYGANFTSIDAVINLEGGTMDQGLELVNSELNMTAGIIQSNAFAYGESCVSVLGGSSGNIQIHDASKIVIDGGVVSTLTVFDLGVARLESGSANRVNLRQGTTFNWTGGEANVITVADANANLAGTQFQLVDLDTGDLIEDLTPSIQSGSRVVISQRDVKLVATLPDGSISTIDLYPTFVSSNDDLITVDSVLTIGLSLNPVITPDTIEINRGMLASGGLPELATSDNSDLVIRRSNQDIQSVTQFEIGATSPSQSPTSIEFTLEASVFARNGNG